MLTAWSSLPIIFGHIGEDESHLTESITFLEQMVKREEECHLSGTSALLK